jgi:hypothetical protein
MPRKSPGSYHEVCLDSTGNFRHTAPVSRRGLLLISRVERMGQAVTLPE